MNTQTQALAAGEEGDRRAAQLAAGGATLGQIAAKFDPPLSIEQARAAVARGRQQVSDRAPKPMPPRPQQEQKRSVLLDTDELLAWAEQEGPARARTLAARARAQLAEIAQLREQHAATDVLRKTIAVLERQLAEAKTELRQKTTVKPPAAPGGASVEQGTGGLAAVRVWARANGHEVADVGKVPTAVVEAYRRAHADGEPS